MQSELEKTQLEIAKAQLAQEQMKLAKMQRNQQALNSLGQGAAVLGEGAAKGAGYLIGAVATWVMYFVMATLAMALILVFKIKNAPGDFVHAYGYYLGLSAHIVVPAVFIISTVCAFLALRSTKQDAANTTFAIGLIATAGLVYLTV